jgi:negative regulator of sigma E activity
VFVEHQETLPQSQAAAAAAQETPVAEAATVGSSSAFSTVVDGHKITAVGEVPPETVQFIATQVKAQSALAPGRR